MSFNVLIGTEDAHKVEDTVAILEFVTQILDNHTTFQLPTKTYSLEELSSLLDWYKSLYNILSTSGNEEDIILEPITT